MRYISTRGSAPPLGFEDVLLAGLARDGGLYVPERWPELSREEIAALEGLPYAEAARRIMQPFVGDALAPEELAAIVEEAYAQFGHRAIAPLVQLAPGQWILELFHGPTFAFKDFAMQVLARLMDHALKRRDQRVTIVGATSGDTGSAAIEAFRGRERADIFILHPEGRVSEVQRRQMTSAAEENVHNIAVRGTFDDCQALVKALFNDHALRDRLSLAAVNSINWARIMAQTVYYFTSAVGLGAPHRPVSFSVPTGNFGDVFAGYVASRMGLPVSRLAIATNVNDILVRALATGRYEARQVVATSSPSMDIQVSSNFERLIFEAAGRDADLVSAHMEEFASTGAFSFSDNELAFVRERFSAFRADEEETAATLRSTLEGSAYLADPHTAVGLHAAQRMRGEEQPVITLATAHPAKFPDAVRAACGREAALPERLAAVMEAPERYTVLDNDYRTVSTFIESHARVPAGAAP
ncbi:MAG: threonine synthase [Methyloligellaceae bacterium]